MMIAENASAITQVIAIASAIVAILSLAATVWKNRREDTRAERKDGREEIGNTRAENQADIDRLRNIANDALAREKLAYERVARAETKADLAETEMEKLRATVDALTTRVAHLEADADEAKRRATFAEEEAKRLRQYVDLLRAELERRGVQLPYDDSGGAP